MTVADTVKALQKIGSEPLLEARAGEVSALGEFSVEPRAGVFGAYLAIDTPFANVRDELLSYVGKPAIEGKDDEGVSWLAYRPTQAVILVAEAGDSTTLYVEPFGRIKNFVGVAPSVRSWLDARRAATSQTTEQREQRKQVRKDVRAKNLTPAAVKSLATQLLELGSQPFTREAGQAFAASKGWILDGDDPVSGLRYLLPDIGTIVMGARGEFVLAILHSGDAKTLGKPYAAARTTLNEVFGEGADNGSYRYVGTTTEWVLYRLPSALALLTQGEDAFAERAAVSLRMLAWDDAELPSIEKSPHEWFSGVVRTRR